MWTSTPGGGRSPGCRSGRSCSPAPSPTTSALGDPQADDAAVRRRRPASRGHRVPRSPGRRARHGARRRRRRPVGRAAAAHRARPRVPARRAAGAARRADGQPRRRTPRRASSTRSGTWLAAVPSSWPRTARASSRSLDREIRRDLGGGDGVSDDASSAGLALSLLTGVGAAGAGVGLMATSAWLISRAAAHPPVLHLMVAIVAVRAFGIGRGVLRYVERLTGHDAALRVLAAVRVRCYRTARAAGPGRARRLPPRRRRAAPGRRHRRVVDLHRPGRAAADRRH